MFTKEEFDFAKRLYHPLKVVELCEEHDVEIIGYKKLGDNWTFQIKKLGLYAGIIIYRHVKTCDVLYYIEKMIRHLDWELIQRAKK